MSELDDDDDEYEPWEEEDGHDMCRCGRCGSVMQDYEGTTDFYGSICDMCCLVVGVPPAWWKNEGESP